MNPINDHDSFTNTQPSMNHTIVIDWWGGPAGHAPSTDVCDRLREGVIRMRQVGSDQASAMLLLFQTTLGLVFVSRVLSSVVWFINIVVIWWNEKQTEMNRLSIRVVHVVEWLASIAAILAFIVLILPIDGDVRNAGWTWLTLILLQSTSAFGHVLSVFRTTTESDKDDMHAWEHHMLQNSAIGILLLTLNLGHRNDVLIAATLIMLVATHAGKAEQLPMTWALKILAEVTITVAILQQSQALPDWFIPGSINDSRWFSILILFWILIVYQFIKNVVRLVVWQQPAFLYRGIGANGADRRRALGEEDNEMMWMVWHGILFASAFIILLVLPASPVQVDPDASTLKLAVPGTESVDYRVQGNRLLTAGGPEPVGWPWGNAMSIRNEFDQTVLMEIDEDCTWTVPHEKWSIPQALNVNDYSVFHPSCNVVNFKFCLPLYSFCKPETELLNVHIKEFTPISVEGWQTATEGNENFVLFKDPQNGNRLNFCVWRNNRCLTGTRPAGTHYQKTPRDATNDLKWH